MAKTTKKQQRSSQVVQAAALKVLTLENRQLQLNEQKNAKTIAKQLETITGQAHHMAEVNKRNELLRGAVRKLELKEPMTFIGALMALNDPQFAEYGVKRRSAAEWSDLILAAAWSGRKVRGYMLLTVSRPDEMCQYSPSADDTRATDWVLVKL